MGTPAVITFIGHDGYRAPQNKSLFKHHDGDPVTVLRDLAAVVGVATDMRDRYRAEAEHIAEHIQVIPATLYGLYIGHTTTAMGMPCAPAPGIAAESMYGQWRYVVNTDAGAFTVTDDDGNFVDPHDYLDCLQAECRESHRAALDTALGDLLALGFTIEPH